MYIHTFKTIIMDTQTQTKTLWKVDDTHSEMGFSVRHMMISRVRGQFNEFDVNVNAANDDFSDAEIEVKVAIASINTSNADRDAHLKSDDFFNAEEYPYMTFKSNSFDGKTLVGELTIRDVTKTVELKAEHLGTEVDPYGQTKAGFEITGDLNRKEYNLKWDAVTEAGKIVVSDQVKLELQVQLVKQS